MVLTQLPEWKRSNPLPDSDDSSSMDFEDDGRRKKTLKKVLDAIAEVYELARDEGIMSIRYLNGRQGRKDVTRDKVEDLHNAIQYNGVTMIGTQLQAKILKPFVEQKDMTKPLLIIVITDGSVSPPSSTSRCADYVSRSRVRGRDFWRKSSTTALLGYNRIPERRWTVRNMSPKHGLDL